MMSDPRFRRTKIVATLGPSSANRETVAAMIDAGVNVMRINSAHGTARARADWMQLVRDVSQKNGRHVALLVDLQGPRIRVGELGAPRQLVEEEEVVFAPAEMAKGEEIPVTYAALADDVGPGTTILLDDGLLAVEALEASGRRVRGRVRHGGELSSHKGINLIGVQLSAPSITEKDRGDIEIALECGVDYIGISFVQRADDIDQVRSLINGTVRIVAKIEKASALAELEQIVLATDAVMVARGDLGVELPFEEVPLAQKRVIEMCNRHGRAVITATQMLESMVRNPRPTRAEASDVANAILDGTDAVMLSAETAVGAYPVQAVQAMTRIIMEIERSEFEHQAPRRHTEDFAPGQVPDTADAIAVATCAAAEMLRVPLITCFSKSGFTARKIARCRPAVPVLGFSTEAATCRQLSLVWGVVPELSELAANYDEMISNARQTLLSKGYASAGDRIVVTAGVPFEVVGTTNLLRVEVV